jgi:alcohol dehydrogenase/L-iditol 2-dehydrogenase
MYVRRTTDICKRITGFIHEWSVVKSITLVENNVLKLTNTVPEPNVSRGEVKIRMLAGGVCGSDLSVIHGTRAIPGYPWIIGHEGGGIVVDVADDVSNLVKGDLVIIEPNIACMRCTWCLRGETKMCALRGILGINMPGIFSEFVVIPAPFAWKVPASTPKSVLASFEPSVVAHVAVQRYLGAKYNNVLVMGAGSQGLIVIALLVQAGFAPAVSEPNPEKMVAALSHGAHRLSDSPDELFELVFETSGAPAGLRSAIDHAEKLGTLCVIGQSGRPTEIISQTIVQRELKINGQLIYNHPQDFGSAIGSLADNSLDPTIALREPVSPAQGVSDILAAAELGGKIWIDFEDWN